MAESYIDLGTNKTLFKNYNSGKCIGIKSILI